MRFYICGVAMQHELGETVVKTYPSVKVLKESSDCWRECGIVEVNLDEHKIFWVEDQQIERTFHRSDPRQLVMEFDPEN